MMTNPAATDTIPAEISISGVDKSQNGGYNEYKSSVPEASENDYKLYKAVTSLGIAGTVRVPPELMSSETISKLAFNDSHALRHGCTIDDARSYVENAKCSIRRKRWDGESINYYSIDGATYIDCVSGKIKTAYSQEDFDDMTQKIMEILK